MATIRELKIIASPLDKIIWDVEVYIDGMAMGGGTGEYPLDIANRILYGDSNDWLNGDYGVLGQN